MRAAPPEVVQDAVPHGAPPAPTRTAALPGRHQDPIIAIASAPGRGAVGIVRASGRDLTSLIDAVCGRALLPRQATLLPFLGDDGLALDRGLALHFPAPQSYTGEEVLELQAHGGPVLLQLLLARCLQAQPGLRLAEPGEFTERAFLNNKLDLAQAEAVADLIDASTEAAARSAARSLSGAFSEQITRLAERTVHLRMLVEATLDFPEEEIDFLEKAGARGQLDALLATVNEALARTRQGALLREGLRVVLAGQPNVGKSSLLNALAGAELAIVTPMPGTTRDRVSETLQIEGVPLHITDTAGLRADAEAADEVERIGIGRSWQAIGAADVVLFLHDLGRVGQADYGRTLDHRGLHRQMRGGGAWRSPGSCCWPSCGAEPRRPFEPWAKSPPAPTARSPADVARLVVDAGGVFSTAPAAVVPGLAVRVDQSRQCDAAGPLRGVATRRRPGRWWS